MNRSVLLLVLGSVAAFACSDPELEKRLQDLEGKVDSIEKKGVGVGAPGAPTASPEQEQAAGDLLRQAAEMMEKNDFDNARAKLDELQKSYPNTRSAKASVKYAQDLAVIGKPEAPLTVEKWFQGSEADIKDGKAKLLVFWEVWCPHCKREVPKLAETYNKFNKQGLEVVGLTKMTRDITEQQVNDFIRENNLPYPIAKEQGDAMSKAYGVQGIPAAAIVKDGKVVWRGHPGRLTDEMIQGYLGS